MTKVQRCDVLVDDPYPVLEWLVANVSNHIVRKMAYETSLGWHIKIALDGQDAVARFWSRWARDDARLQAPPRRAKRLNAIRERNRVAGEHPAARAS